MARDRLELGPIGQLSLLARDAKRAENFYRDVLGLTHLYTFGDLVFFDANGTRLFIRAVPEEEWRPSSIVYFRVSDIDAAWRAAEESGAATTSGPQRVHRHGDGTEEWMAFFEDTEGNTLALMTSVAPAST